MRPAGRPKSLVQLTRDREVWGPPTMAPGPFSPPCDPSMAQSRIVGDEYTWTARCYTLGGCLKGARHSLPAGPCAVPGSSPGPRRSSGPKDIIKVAASCQSGTDVKAGLPEANSQPRRRCLCKRPVHPTEARSMLLSESTTRRAPDRRSRCAAPGSLIFFPEAGRPASRSALEVRKPQLST